MHIDPQLSPNITILELTSDTLSPLLDQIPFSLVFIYLHFESEKVYATFGLGQKTRGAL